MPIISYDEYSKINHPRPYFYKIKSGENFLYYFGEEHSFDPKHKQWQVMKNFWREFLKDTENKNRIVFVESKVSKIEENEDLTVINKAGPGLITFIAFENGIFTFCPESSFREQFMYLEKYFLHEEIQYYYFARMVLQWNKTNKKIDFEKFIQPYLDRDKKESEWNDVDFTIDGMKKIHNKIFGIKFNENDEKFFRSVVSPVELKTIINKINRALSDFRNEYIVQKIKEYIDNNYSVFAVYGCTHVVVQEPLLREVL
jgi:hypothetical protein